MRLNRSHLPTFPPGTIHSREWGKPYTTRDSSVPAQVVPRGLPGRLKPSVYMAFPLPGDSLLQRVGNIGNVPPLVIDKATRRERALPELNFMLPVSKATRTNATPPALGRGWGT